MSEELHRSKSAFHDITVNDEDGVVTLRFSGRKQSSLRGADGIEACQPYIDYLHLPVAIAPDPRRALLIGLGGGVLAKRMWHDYPDMRIDVAELDPEVVDVARTYFGLPADDQRLRVIVGDGRAYLEGTDATYDVIIVDAYFEALAPYALVTREFFALVAARLAPQGVMGYNVVAVPEGAGSEPFQRFLAGVAVSLPGVAVFRVGASCGGGRENIVVTATAEPLDQAEVAARVSAAAGKRVSVPGCAEMVEQMSVPELATDVVPMVDAETPEDGFFHT